MIGADAALLKLARGRAVAGAITAAHRYDPPLITALPGARGPPYLPARCVSRSSAAVE